MLGADATLASGFNLGPVGNVAAQALKVLVVDVLDVLDAEGADAPAGCIATTGPSAGARTASRSGAALLITAGTSGAGPGTSLSSGSRSGTGLGGLSRG